MRGPRQSFLGIGLVAVLCIALSGCTVRIDCQTALQGIPKAVSLHAPDVAIAVVTKDGHVFPKDLIVRGGDHAVVWVAEGQALSIAFKKAPFQAVCEGAICWLTQPPPKPEGEKPIVYEYGGTITPAGAGAPISLDPGLEVVK